MKIMKKILCTVLVVVMCLTAAPLQGFANLDWNWLDFSLKASAATEGYYEYWVENGEATITGVDTSISGAVTIPSTLGGYSVTSIDSNALMECASLTSITIPDSVTTIGIVAFAGCLNLTNITVDDDNQYFSNDSDGVLFNKDKTELVAYPAGKTRTTYIIPDGVTSIGLGAFAVCKNLTSVTIPDSVTSIGELAFYECSSLTSITIPDSVTTIGDYSFFFCTSLTSITIPDSVTSIGEMAFYYCTSLTSVTIPDSVTSIGERAFAICTSLTSISIPASVTSLGYGAFGGCDLISFTVDADNQYFSSDSDGVLFNKDKDILIQYPDGNTRSSYIIPDSVTSIGYGAFASCTSLTSITIPDSVTSISDYAFNCCTNLTSIIIPDSVTTIGYGAFSGCSNLTSITISDGVTSIGDNAFYGCTGLEDVYYMGSQSQWSEISIGSTNEDLTNAKIHFTSCTANLGKHVYTSEITTAPTHFKEGVETFTCACGDSYTEVIAKTKEHSYVASKVVAPTCEKEGYTVYVCECGHSENRDKKSATGHEYDGLNCKICGKKCSCNCHKGGISGFFFKIILFFQKIFKTNKTCSCGVAHY